jgi:hypothetical protein
MEAFGKDKTVPVAQGQPLIGGFFGESKRQHR